MAAGAEKNRADWREGFAAALLDPVREPPPGLKAWNGSDPAARFAVYRNNVVVNLIDWLAETFPVCCELVGEEFFRAMVDVFVRNHPPKGPVLSGYGAGLPGFIETFEPAAELPYLPDVACLEAARVEAYHAADAAPLEVKDWAAIAPESLAACIIRTHPSARVMRSDYAAYSIWAAHQGAMEIADVEIDAAEEYLVIRPALAVEVIGLPVGGALFLCRLGEGASMAQAVTGAQEQTPEFDFAANLAILMQSGFAIGFGS